MNKLKAENLEINNNETIVLALSGGIDSMVLLDLLNRKKNKVDYNLIAVHINHQLRPESKFEEIYLKNYCQENKIKFISEKIDLGNTGIEANARALRYSVLKRIAQENSADKIITAHHKNDQAETIFLHLSRGSGSKGLEGILEKSYLDSFELYRPFINISKKEIIQYGIDNQIPYLNDLSNSENRYTRNIVRNTIFPTIEENFPEFQDKLVQTSNFIQQENNFVNNIINNIIIKWVQVDRDLISFDSRIFTDLNQLLEKEHLDYFDNQSKDFLLKELVRSSISKIGLLKDFTESHVKNIISFFKTNESGSLDLPNNLKAIIASGQYIIGSSDLYGKQFGYYPLEDINVKDRVYYFVKEGISLSVKKGILKDFSIPSKKEKRLLIPEKIIKNQLIVRAKLEGDRINLTGMKNPKKLSRFFIDRKVPAFLRENIPIVADTNQILWIPNFYLNPKIKLDNPNEEVLELTFSKII